MEKRKSKKRCVKRDDGFVSATQTTISQLPDSLLTEILLYLPTKEVVRTSILSNRWRRVWSFISQLDLDSDEFPDYNSFESFMNRFLDNYRQENPCLDKLKLRISEDGYDDFSVMCWIDFLAIHKIKHLDVECIDVGRGCLKVIPFSLYVCETLLHLRLHQVFLGNFESVYLPRVKTMRLEFNVYANEACMELFISSCPVLDDLSIVRRVDDNVEVLRVRSQTLTSLTVGYDSNIDDDDVPRRSSGILIDAPKLEYLNFSNEVSETKTISNLASLAKVEFDGRFGGPDPSEGVDFGIEPPWAKIDLPMDRIFFRGISSASSMIISEMSMEFFYSYMRMEPLPPFRNLSSLEAAFCSLDLNFLPTILECCPNLKSFITDIRIRRNLIHGIRLSSVPLCVSSSLEMVEITSEFMGSFIEFDVASYFLQNSSLLKQFVVHFAGSMQNESLVFLRDLRALPRLSSMCKIVCASGADC